MATNDLDLLRQFTRDQSQDAFTALVQRHVNLVYSAALRQVRSPQLAEEVAQSVFADLARQGARLKPDTILTAWLYRVTRRTAVDTVRREARRQARERLAAEMIAMNTASDWPLVEPLLDEAMDALDETDRAAILLRFFENRSLREVGQTLGTSDDAAQKRVTRAVERLREFFAKRGVAVGASALAIAVSANAVQAAPVGLAATLASAACASAAIGGGTLTLLKLMAATKLKAGVISAVVVATAATSLVIQHRAEARLRQSNGLIQSQFDELARMQAENERLSNLAALAARPSANNAEELQRLRDRAAELRRQSNDLAALRDENRQLQAALVKARQDLRSPNVEPTVLSEPAKARSAYCKELARAAMMYASEHQDQFPTSLDHAANFMSAEARQPTDLTMAQFEIVYRGTRAGLSKYAHPGAILLIRERQSWRNTDGKWVKAYASADGGGMVLSVVDGNFDAWEKQHIIPPDSSKR